MTSLAQAFSPYAGNTPPLFKHQEETIAKLRSGPHWFVTSDPGTAKTRAWLEWFREHREEGGGKALVLCPKSIMTAAWFNDAARWTPELRVSVATATNRRDALRQDADLYIVNHDAVRQLIKDPSLLPKGLDAFNVDESGAYRNPTSLRSKAVRKLLEPFEHRVCMNGTPAPNGPLDLFHQMLLVDKGALLGDNYYRYRAKTCEPEKVAPHLPHVNWVPRPGIMEALADLLEPITIRYRLEDVIDMPDRVVQTLDFAPSAKHLAAYHELRKHQLAVTAEGEQVSAIHAAALRTKLLQMCLAQGTEVLTQKGWLPIETLHPDAHLVWDGHEWARFDEVLNQGWQPVIECEGVRMTPDHLVLTTNGWMPAGDIINANASERPDRVHPPHPVPTYDLANVGPRNQFVVRGADGTPLTVHNCSGAVYDELGHVVTFDSARYELIADLVEARAATLVGFQYRHTREALEQEFAKRKIKYGVIDGTVTSMDARTEIVRRFEAGDLQCVLAHPQSAGHGLTLVRASAVIWASPTDRSDLYQQFNARIYRAGQKKRTEIIKIAAAGTVEAKAYDQLKTKVSNEQALLELLT